MFGIGGGEWGSVRGSWKRDEKLLRVPKEDLILSINTIKYAYGQRHDGSAFPGGMPQPLSEYESRSALSSTLVPDTFRSPTGLPLADLHRRRRQDYLGGDGRASRIHWLVRYRVLGQFAGGGGLVYFPCQRTQLPNPTSHAGTRNPKQPRPSGCPPPNMAGSTDDTDPVAADLAKTVNAAANDLARRCEVLQSELKQFKDHLNQVYDGYFQTFPKEMHHALATSVRTEAEALNKRPDTADPNASHRVHSSNVPFLETVWAAAKHSRELVKLRHPVAGPPFKSPILALGKRIILSQGESAQKRSDGFVVDVICDGGLSWLKVSTMTNKRILFDLAKEAIYDQDSSDEDNNAAGGAGTGTQDYSEIQLFKMAKNLFTVVQGHRIRNQCPSPHLILPRVFEGEHAEIDRVLEACRRLGVILVCGNEVPPAAPLSEDMLNAMVPGPKAGLTRVMNVDTSVLVALASDFAHTKVEHQPWFSHSHRDHADLELAEPLLPILYPVLEGRELVCTKEAAEAFTHIVHTIATDSENTRASLLLDVDPAKRSEERVQGLRSLSIHETPSSLHLPIRILDIKESEWQQDLTPAMQETLSQLLNPGRSVFSYGWVKGITTVTCNAVAVRQLEKGLEKLPSLEPLGWPSMWTLASSRPLVGIPKSSSAPKIRKHIGDCSVTCTCGVEQLYGGRSDVTII
ncbi:hypothetical protein F4780DRAFT_737056 [Xylariomycetidae sp. FL0641]|nr:hypothetical protein F4780DRAFT_737056 [Xylariomycetidae sp. FL0641]